MQRHINNLNTQLFDLLVIGGGIYGAWTAYDAALRGLKVAIVDKNDWGSGTSSESSKLIHGGLRYLETLNVKLVKKSLAEREMFLTAAPHRVWPLRFGIPTSTQNRLNPLKLGVGLWLYDWLAGNLSGPKAHQHYSKNEFLAHFPAVKQDGLTGGFSYFDGQTDDARFVLEIIDGAIQAGAICVNYCEAIELIETNNKAVGVTARNILTNELNNVSAKQIVDTTGRWSGQFQRKANNYRLAKGIHLVMPKILDKAALLLTAKSDGRVFFIIPWYDLTLLGTTDTDYAGDLDKVEITEQDIHYLLTEANLALASANWSKTDIIGKFVGLRVLQESNRKNPSSISRDWALVTAENGLLSSIGGKLTSAREDAATIVDAVCAKLGNAASCPTFGKAFPWLQNSDYGTLLKSIIEQAKQLDIDETCATWLVKRYGERSQLIIELCKNNPEHHQRIRPELPFLKAELVFCAKHEMVVHLEDLLRRRIPLQILAKISTEEVTQIAQLVAKTLDWDSRTTDDEIASYHKKITIN